jgi:hypothetical protein
LAFEDIKEKLSNQLKSTWEKVQDSSVYISARDRFENLSPVMQKVVIAATALTVSLIILSFPYGSLISSWESASQFEQTRNLTRDLLKAARESSNIPQISPPSPVDTLQATVQSQLQRASLLPEQIASISSVEATSELIPKQLVSYALEVSLAKLNLTQVTELGYQISIQGVDRGMTIKMTDLEIKPNASDSRYLDVIYKLVGIKVPEFGPIFPAEKSNGKGKKGKRPKVTEDKAETNE